jgi:hypothetical protein
MLALVQGFRITPIVEALCREATVDANEYIRNVSAHSLEYLAPYVEKHVAWSEDGKQILAAADTLGDLYKEIDRLGLKQYVIGFVLDPDVSYFGGGWGL